MRSFDILDIKILVDKYRPGVFVNISDIYQIDDSQLEKDIDTQMLQEIKNYLKILLEFVRKRDFYYQDNMISLKSWLSKVYELMVAVERIILLCENLTGIYDDERNWARAIAIQYMIRVIESLKSEINILKNNVKSARTISRIRDRASITIAKKFAHFLEVLFTIIQIEEGELDPEEIASVIGGETIDLWEPSVVLR